MATTTKAEIKITDSDLHAVPLTLEGSSVLHQMFRFRWAEWRKLSQTEQHEIAAEASAALLKMENDVAGQTAVFSLLGHKGDLLVVHFRNSFDQLKAAELAISKLRLSDYLEQTTSYLSVVELGLYESSVKLYRELRGKGVEPHSPEWNAAIDDTNRRQTEAMRPRLFPQIPPARYICFYPMDRRRGEDKNWYSLPIEERQRQMEEHGLVGRRYAGTVRQIITGSIGFDDWEWGVDLFADDPLIFKKLIYEMRFDEVSAVYALFGTFYVGVRCPAAGLEGLFSGKLPE
ncbi:MAG TPA: hydrogen peroxide-dependent heme synthase [Verrucomicrobiae bacterium]|nr:hydrogen peroxide-dependent heme synthase [Verrucomicrobiae bacterium]